MPKYSIQISPCSGHRGLEYSLIRLTSILRLRYRLRWRRQLVTREFLSHGRSNWRFQSDKSPLPPWLRAGRTYGDEGEERVVYDAESGMLYVAGINDLFAPPFSASLPVRVRPSAAIERRCDANWSPLLLMMMLARPWPLYRLR